MPLNFISLFTQLIIITMIDMSFLHRITSSPIGKRRKSMCRSDSSHIQSSCNTLEQIAANVRRETSLSNQILQISSESYLQGLGLLNSGKYDEARDCFEAALAARLVLYGPDDERLLDVHGQLRRIAYIQGDVNKAAHHKEKILQIQSLMLMSEHNAYHDKVDWSVLCNE